MTYAVIGCAMKVHSSLGPGFLETVYRNALQYELAKSGLAFEAERAMLVHYDGIVVGDFFADLALEERLIIELKAVRRLTQQHEAQLVNYLTATGIDIGLLINFGGASLEYRRKHRIYKPRENSRDDQLGSDAAERDW